MPNPQASVLHVSPLLRELLQKMVHCSTNAQRLVKRGQIILEAAKGVSNSKIAQHVQMDYETVRRWRDRYFNHSYSRSLLHQPSMFRDLTKQG